MQPTFVETLVFTRKANTALSQDDREVVTEVLVDNPKVAPVIPGTKSLRKLRLAGSGRGKRGGLRVIYAVRQDGELVYLLYLFAKNETEDLTKDDYRQLGKLLD
jgi:hypothetical protein